MLCISLYRIGNGGNKLFVFVFVFVYYIPIDDGMKQVLGRAGGILTIYAPVIYTRPCIMFWRRGYTLRGEVGGVGPWNSRVFWAL